MRYLMFYESYYDNMERGVKLWEQIMEEREKGSDKWPKAEQIVLWPHELESELIDKTRDLQSIFIFDTDDPMHLVNYRMHWAKIFDIRRVIPITPSRMTFEAWQLLK
jgi:hypothetical protein